MQKVKNIPPTGIRIPIQIKEKLKKIAKKEGRSLNKEVIKRLERSLEESEI